VIRELMKAGLDSIPGGGGEILVQRVRDLVAKKKAGADRWLEIMEIAHEEGMKTSVTMMYGLGETLAERLEHLERVRDVQSRTNGFTAFICWPLQPENTPKMSHQPKTDAVEYLRTVAISRIVLDNVPNLQSSWVTMGLKIGQVALRRGLIVFTDDIYEHIAERPIENIGALVPELRPQLVVVNAVSKSYAMTGWRIGYVAGPRDLVQALDTLLSQSTGNCCSISQAAAAAALNGDQRFVTESVAIYKQRRDAALARINAIPGLSCRAPDGAFYLYINCAGLIGKTTPQGKALHEDGDVVMYLLDSVGVAVVAGTAYGLSPYFRLSIATSIEILEEGCARIAGAVAALR